MRRREVQHQPGRREVQREPGRRAGGEQQDDRLGLQPVRGEDERAQRGGVEPLRVVGHDQQRPVLGQPGEQREHGDPGEQRVRRRLGQPERAEQRLRLARGQGRHPVEHRPQQLVQPGEGQILLGLPAGDRQRPHRRRLNDLGQQRGLTQPRITPQHVHAGGRRRWIDQVSQAGQLTVAADHRASGG